MGYETNKIQVYSWNHKVAQQDIATLNVAGVKGEDRDTSRKIFLHTVTETYWDHKWLLWERLTSVSKIHPNNPTE